MTKKHLKRLAKKIAKGKAALVSHKGEIYPIKTR
jgi:hypothetical protein